MKDLKYEQKGSLSRLEAADQLMAIAAALRQGGDAELVLGPGRLSLRIPDELQSETEIEVGDGEIELEIEFKWPTAPARTAPSQAGAAAERAAKSRKSAPAKPGRSSTGTGGKNTKRAAGKAP
ncbi:amphi-Trp domain-containing protein [Streptomyces sp. Tu 2975]|uniref:amphi-Trp domain-containing protein n=1 Tax=Streptomyces sp. Tu 2975 TaxID=2676871 RepID=UPI00135A79D1|nr:amphi-Trp domain-containing protein [Streptomyces sp. Tu 2975]QIP87226.1 amphi-Trp domain-containing protein [Streptomyces sp. Tu 2975]